jgi:hypothetical protein
VKIIPYDMITSIEKERCVRSGGHIVCSRPGLVIWAIARCTFIGQYVGLMCSSSALGRFEIPLDGSLHGEVIRGNYRTYSVSLLT